jgi:hypothetical protein
MVEEIGQHDEPRLSFARRLAFGIHDLDHTAALIYVHPRWIHWTLPSDIAYFFAVVEIQYAGLKDSLDKMSCLREKRLPPANHYSRVGRLERLIDTELGKRLEGSREPLYNLWAIRHQVPQNLGRMSLPWGLDDG